MILSMNADDNNAPGPDADRRVQKSEDGGSDEAPLRVPCDDARLGPAGVCFKRLVSCRLRQSQFGSPRSSCPFSTVEVLRA